MFLPDSEFQTIATAFCFWEESGMIPCSTILFLSLITAIRFFFLTWLLFLSTPLPSHQVLLVNPCSTSLWPDQSWYFPLNYSHQLHSTFRLLITQAHYYSKLCDAMIPVLKVGPLTFGPPPSNVTFVFPLWSYMFPPGILVLPNSPKMCGSVDQLAKVNYLWEVKNKI